jgi:hypothetical protein
MKKDILFLGTISVKNDPATFSLLWLVFRYSGYVNVKCSSIYRGPKDIVHPCSVCEGFAGGGGRSGRTETIGISESSDSYISD